MQMRQMYDKDIERDGVADGVADGDADGDGDGDADGYGNANGENRRVMDQRNIHGSRSMLLMEFIVTNLLQWTLS